MRLAIWCILCSILFSLTLNVQASSLFSDQAQNAHCCSADRADHCSSEADTHSEDEEGNCSSGACNNPFDGCHCNCCKYFDNHLKWIEKEFESNVVSIHFYYVNTLFSFEDQLDPPPPKASFL